MITAVPQSAYYEEHTIDSDGVPITLSVWEGPRGAPCVLFLSGTMLHPLFYAGFLEPLARAGFHVVGIHFAGHGKSPAPERGLGFRDLVRNAQDAVTFAISRFGSRPLLLGTGQGAMVALDLASRDHRPGAVFAHGMVLPQLEASVLVTRFPVWMRPLRRAIVGGMRLGARVFPRLPVPARAYLAPERVFPTAQAEKRFREDPLALPSYPLHFLATLFSAHILPVSRSPFVLLAAEGDPLFPLPYQKRVYRTIRAPRKELLVLRLDGHPILNDAPDEVVVPALAAKLHQYA